MLAEAEAALPLDTQLPAVLVVGAEAAKPLQLHLLLVLLIPAAVVAVAEHNLRALVHRVAPASFSSSTHWVLLRS
jgi:cell division protein FtsL